MLQQRSHPLSALLSWRWGKGGKEGLCRKGVGKRWNGWGVGPSSASVYQYPISILFPHSPWFWTCKMACTGPLSPIGAVESCPRGKEIFVSSRIAAHHHQRGRQLVRNGLRKYCHFRERMWIKCQYDPLQLISWCSSKTFVHLQEV